VGIAKFYAGIGSRETPITLEPSISQIVTELNSQGYTLRSGGADGADTFFERHAIKKEIYLPWRSFNRNNSNLYTLTAEAFALAEKYHPAWDKLSQAGKKLMARNCYQILGRDLKSPVDFVVCWTKDGHASGGTGRALRLAEDLNIPVYNLYWQDDLLKLPSRIGPNLW